MHEPVRLVIWDLDDTFWQGIASEGQITISPRNREIVIELARRGIISSICSKNELGTVRRILEDCDVWHYFVLPSISWEPKGPRIRALVKALQLRPSTALFIDDNPSNLEEARTFVPDIEIANEAFLLEILDHPMLRGKDDSTFSRLTQYKALENRKADEMAAGSDVARFLRDSCIRVRLDFDIEPHIDRFVELINRTNQLNFTKVRMSENLEEARREALALLRSYYVQAALVHVMDRYGDHGYCGLYVHDSEARKLLHFCFSCRILGMGVEHWLYHKLNRPWINVCGEVLSNLADTSFNVDWITQVPNEDDVTHANSSSSGSQLLVDRVTARGGCELGAVVHYFTATASHAIGEYHIHRNGGTFRIDHSVFARQAIEGLSFNALEASKRLGYIETDFKTRLFDDETRHHLILLNFTADSMHALYRHRGTGLTVPFYVPGLGRTREDVRSIATTDLPIVDARAANWMPSAFQFLKDEFDFLGCIKEEDFKRNLSLIFQNLSGTAQVFVLETPEPPYDHGYVQEAQKQDAGQVNRWIREVCGTFQVDTVRMTDCVYESREILDALHYDRIVYFRIYQEISSRVSRRAWSPSLNGIGQVRTCSTGTNP